MFKAPVKHTPLKSLEEVKKYSDLRNTTVNSPMVYCKNNGHIAFSDEKSNLWVTPYRQEIIPILDKNGYTSSSLPVPYSCDTEISDYDYYRWLIRIAHQENWAATHTEAFSIASKKGILPVDISTDRLHIHEIGFFTDEELFMNFSAMGDLWLSGLSKENIGTYIVIDSKTLLVCDEYCRTFLLKSKDIINDILNELIDAGYRANPHPWYYVHSYTPEDNDKKS